MCYPASFWMTKTNVYWSKRTDSHEEIAKEFNLRDAFGGRLKAARVEITPPNQNMFAPLDQWKFKLDELRVPDWFDRERDEARARKALEKWAEARIFDQPTSTVHIYNAQVWVRGGNITASHGSRIKAIEGSIIDAHDGSCVQIDNGTLFSYGHSSCYASNSNVEAHGSSMVVAYNCNIEAFGKSRIDDHGSNRIVTNDDSVVDMRNHFRCFKRSKITAKGNSIILTKRKENITLEDQAVEIMYKNENKRLPEIYIAP